MSYFDEPYRVLVSVNESGLVTAVNSSAFLNDESGWTQIDSGHGDKYHHAQGNYFSKPVRTVGGAYRYKMVDGVPVECSNDEIKAQEEANKPVPEATLENRVETLETDTADLAEALNMILEGVTE